METKAAERGVAEEKKKGRQPPIGRSMTRKRKEFSTKEGRPIKIGG